MTASTDVTQALKDAENALRDFVANVLGNKHREAWVERAGVTQERLDHWRARKASEAQRQEAGVVEERLIYYADFYDLSTILKKNWSDFATALGDWKRMEVLLKELEHLRDPDAHRRELLPHQKHLILGISGEIRNRIVRYRSKQETAEDYFPRIESVRDSLGHIWVPTPPRLRTMATKAVLRPGDVIDFVVTARDPMDEPISYSMNVDRDVFALPDWQDHGMFSLRIEPGDIRRTFIVRFTIRSQREYHALSDEDDAVEFSYQVLPPKR